MGQISIRVNDDDERALKRAARENHQTLADFLRDRIFDQKIQPLDRISTEEKITMLEKEIKNIREMLTNEHNHMQHILIPFLIKSFSAISRAEEPDFVELYKEGASP